MQAQIAQHRLLRLLSPPSRSRLPLLPSHHATPLLPHSRLGEGNVALAAAAAGSGGWRTRSGSRTPRPAAAGEEEEEEEKAGKAGRAAPDRSIHIIPVLTLLCFLVLFLLSHDPASSSLAIATGR